MEITKLGYQLSEPGKLEQPEIHRRQIKTKGYRKGERERRKKRQRNISSELLLFFCLAEIKDDESLDFCNAFGSRTCDTRHFHFKFVTFFSPVFVSPAAIISSHASYAQYLRCLFIPAETKNDLKQGGRGGG